MQRAARLRDVEIEMEIEKRETRFLKRRVGFT
jgi:hypothetical protein